MQCKIFSLSSLNVDCISPLWDSCQQCFSTCCVHCKHLLLVKPHLSLPLFLSFPIPSLAPGVQRKPFSSPEHCRLLCSRWEDPRIFVELMDCSSTLQEHRLCLPAAACREAAWGWCLSLSPSRSLHALASLLSARLMFLPSIWLPPTGSSPIPFYSLWLLNSTTEMCLEEHVQPAVGLSSPCRRVFFTAHLPLTYWKDCVMHKYWKVIK